jgi:two-component system chemotaxis sensor kinase CheA
VSPDSKRSKKLLRQFAKQLGSADAEARLAALEKTLAAAPPQGLEDTLAILRNMPVFFDNIDASYGDYDEQIHMAVRNLELSSSELNNANHSLELLNASINALLDSLGQGVLFFDEKGICSSIFSKACIDLFECSPSGKPVTEVLRCEAALAQSLQDLIDMLFAGQMALGFEELAVLAPKTFPHSRELAINLEYRPLYASDGKLRAVVVIATDCTHEIESLRQLAEKESRAVRTLRISRNRNFFIRFIRQFNEIFDPALDLSVYSREQLKRDIHTLKGTVDTFQLAELGEGLHDLEDALADSTQNPAEVINRLRPALQEQFQNAIGLAREVLGADFESFGKVHAISSQQLFAFAHTLKEGVEKGRKADFLTELFYRTLAASPIWELLGDFSIYVEELADRFGKRLDPCIFTGDNFVLLPEVYEGFFSTLSHVARNIIDHGIEDAGVRVECGKAPEGHVILTTGTYSENGVDGFTIEIADDGRGIHAEHLRQSLTRRGLKAFAEATPHQMIQAIFEDDISTSAAVGTLSGRGVGMSAVKAEVVRLGGSIEAFSTAGAGMRLVIKLPFIWKPELES